MELIYSRDQSERTRHQRLNDFLEKVYDLKTALETGPKDKYGNICFNMDRVSHRTTVEDFLRTDVLDYVKRRDCRFSGTVHGVGSCFVGVSVSSNEADLLFMIDIEGTLEECKDLPGYAKYRLSGTSLGKWKDCITGDGYLMSTKLATLFYHYVEEALGSDLRHKLCKSGTDIIPKIDLTGIGTIATTVTVTYERATIDFDLVVAVSCKGLPPLATAPWLLGNSAWPNSDSVAKIKESGFQLVSKAPYPVNEDERPTLWRISFSLAETMLLQELDANINDYGLCTKQCFVLMKFYRMCYLAPTQINTTPVLKSYYLKVLLLSECHRYPDPASWTYDKLAERFLSMYRQLYKIAKEERMSDFFMPSVNITTSPMSGIRRSLEYLLEKPEEALEAWTKSTNKAFVVNMPEWESTYFQHKEDFLRHTFD